MVKWLTLMIAIWLCRNFSSHPKFAAAVFTVLVPTIIGISAVRAVSNARTKTPVIRAVSNVFGFVGLLAGYELGHRIYWESHGPSLPWLYTVPAATLGGVLLSLLASTATQRESSENSGRAA